MGIAGRAIRPYHRHLVAGRRLADRAGARHAHARAGRQHEIAFRLAVEFVDDEAKRLAAPGVGFSAERFAARGQRAQTNDVATARRGRRAQHAQRGGRNEGVAHLQPRHQFVGGLRIKSVEPTRDDGDAKPQARQQHIEQAARPGPVCGRPEQVALAREKIMGELHARQMTQQHAVPMQRALRRAGRAGCVDHERGVVGAVVERREIRTRLAHQSMKIDRRAIRSISRQDEPEIGQGRRDGTQLLHAGRVGDDDARARVPQAIVERLGPEERGKWQRHGAQLVDGDMRDRGRQRLRQ